jgi:hypothetical protein
MLIYNLCYLTHQRTNHRSTKHTSKLPSDSRFHTQDSFQKVNIEQPNRFIEIQMLWLEKSPRN